jgi:hypothetical protein
MQHEDELGAPKRVDRSTFHELKARGVAGPLH